MHNRQLLGKWFLILTCVAMAICLAQRAIYLHHFLQDATHQVQPLKTPAVSVGQDADESQHSPSPCQISGCSLLCTQPVFFEGALPAVIIFLALLQLFAEVRTYIFRDEPARPPTLRIHLVNCVFRE